LGIPVSIVTGFAADAIAQHVAARVPRPTLIANADFMVGSVVSLVCGLATVTGPLLLLDGDVCFHPDVLRNLVRAPADDALAIDVGTEFTDEQYMAGIDGARVTALRRGPVRGHEASGEWVGFAKLSAASTHALRARVEAQVAAGHTSGGYEDALASLLSAVRVAPVATGGLPWVEIDFPADLARATQLFAAASD
jgi:choline kinase